MSIPDKLLFRIDEAAAYWAVSRRTVYRWIQTGQLPAVRVRGRLRIPAAALQGPAEHES